MSIRLTESRLRQIIREEAKRLIEMGPLHSPDFHEGARLAAEAILDEIGPTAWRKISKGDPAAESRATEIIAEIGGIEETSEEWYAMYDAVMGHLERGSHSSSRSGTNSTVADYHHRQSVRAFKGFK